MPDNTKPDNTKPYNILILGGSGFLSGTLAQQALAAGHHVWTVTRGQRPVLDGVTALVADRHDSNAFQQAVASASTHWDLVVDCIGFDPADARQDLSVFRELTDHLVFVSTDFVYDPQHRRFPQGEETEHYLAHSYGGKKRQCELEFINGDAGTMRWTVVRPGHIYGPGSLLGCLPLHGRDPDLLEKLQNGETFQLVGGGHFLQQPIFAPDLAELILSVPGTDGVHEQIYCVAGPDIIESRTYYEIIADILGVPLRVEEVPVDAYFAENPDRGSFLCHRFYDLSKLQQSGLAVPGISMAEGLRQHVESLQAAD